MASYEYCLWLFGPSVVLFAELKHLNAFHKIVKILYHACSDKLLSTVTYSHVHAYI